MSKLQKEIMDIIHICFKLFDIGHLKKKDVSTNNVHS